MTAHRWRVTRRLTTDFEFEVTAADEEEAERIASRLALSTDQASHAAWSTQNIQRLTRRGWREYPTAQETRDDR